MNEEEISEIIDAYSEALVNTSHIVGKLSELPYSKDTIAAALLEAYGMAEDEETKAMLEEAYLKLESFLEDKEFEALSEYLSLLSDLKEQEEDEEKVFEMAAKQIPDTALEVLDILKGIEENLKKRRAKLVAH